LDIAYRAVQTAEAVTLCARHGFLSVPSIFGDEQTGLPLDTLITNLFESAHEHNWIAALRLKWRVTTVLIRLGFALATGSSCGFNQWCAGVQHVKRGYNIINKSTAAMPYINAPYKDAHWLGSLYRYWDGPRPDKHITVVTADVSCVRDKTVVFSDGTTVNNVDVIVLATGYRQCFPFLHKQQQCSSDLQQRSSDLQQQQHSTTVCIEVTESTNDSIAAAGNSNDGCVKQTTVADSESCGCTAPLDCVTCSSNRSSCDHKPASTAAALNTATASACSTDSSSTNMCEDALPAANEGHHITTADEPTLAYIGIVRPNVGAIPPM
jgi:Flavin-binding monooxygenase-like